MNVLPRRIEQKRTIFQWYQDWLGRFPLTMQPETGGGLSNRWLSAILTDPGSPVTPSEVLAALECENIEGRYLWKPMHLQPVFRQMKYVALDSSVSEDLFSRGVCLPSDTRMTPEDVSRVCKVISGLF